MSHDNTPAEVLRASILSSGLGTLRSANPTGAWPVFVGHIPDEPDNAICIYDTSGIHEGRLQATGQTLQKPGFQIMVRGTDHRTAYVKMRALATHLDTILRKRVLVGTDYYDIQAVKQTGTVLSLGQEPEGTGRNLFTLNGTITYADAA